MNEEPNQQMTVASNPFGAKSQSLAAVQVEQERAVAEVQAAMLLARRFPRNPVDAMDRILNACTRPSLAEGALYTYSRGGSDISGPSIRLAEALAQCWGNIQFGIRELEQRDGESTVEAFAWDVETNTRQVKLFQVRHERHTKQGAKRLTDPRDIYELVANQGARRLRACILGVIPGDVTEQAVKQCDLTLSASADTSPENVKKMLSAFESKFGVTKEQIEKRIQRRVEAMQPAQMVSLKKVYASLNDGMSKAEDWFEGAQAPAAALKFTQPEPAAQTPPAETPSQPEPSQEPAPDQAPSSADEHLLRLQDAMEDDSVPWTKVRAWAHEKGLCEKSALFKTLTDARAKVILEHWTEVKA